MNIERVPWQYSWFGLVWYRKYIGVLFACYSIILSHLYTLAISILRCFAWISLVLILFARFVFVHYPSARPTICTFDCTAAHSTLHIDEKRNGLFWKTNKAYTQYFFSDGKHNSIAWSDWQFKYLNRASALTRSTTLHDFADMCCMWNLKLSRRSFGVSSWIFTFCLVHDSFSLSRSVVVGVLQSIWAAI